MSGNDERRVFLIDDRAEVTISGLTITGGDTSFGGGVLNCGVLTVERSTITGNEGTYGGGICNAKSEDTVDGGTLTVKNSTISKNTATGFTTSSGGGIANGCLSSEGGTLTVIGSTITGNTAYWGGGIFSDIFLPGQKAIIANSTISGNLATGRGGGVYNGAGLTAISYTTITNNTSPNGAGSGVGNSNRGSKSPRTEVSSSIIAGNKGTDVDVLTTIANPRNTFVSRGYNVIGDGEATDAFNKAGDKRRVKNPGLKPLADNGGPTRTHALLGSSPAIGASTNKGCPATDQRGAKRPQGGRCDKGSFEFRAKR